MPGQHAILSPSAAHRWLHCTAAPLLEAAEPESTSPYAEEGTLAHAIAAKRLKGMLGHDTGAEDAEIAGLWDKYHTGEMDEAVDFYTQTVWERYQSARSATPDARLLVEVRLDFTEYVPESYGTSDAVIVTDGHIEVIDLKYGKGIPVEAEDNPQMMMYALGAMEAYGFDYGARYAQWTIVQPRLEHVSTWSMHRKGLIGWARCELKTAADAAYSGGRQNPGAWCRFCKVQGKCSALAKRTIAVGNHGPAYINPETAAKLLSELPTIKAFISAFEDECLANALRGEDIPGYKLVRGRSVRRITDPEALIGRLAAEGYDPETYMRPAELDTITNMEKAIGKKRFAALSEGCVTKPEGKPALVPENDPREPINTVNDDFKDFILND